MPDYLNREFDLNASELIDTLDEIPFWSAPFGLKLLDCVRLKKGITALDIGFGTGFPLTELAMRLGNSSKVIGIDPWEKAAVRVQKKLAAYHISNVELIKGMAESTGLDDNTIDLIVSNNGINNVQDLPKVLSECARVIKTGGQFVQTVNLDQSMIEFYDILKSVLVKLGLRNELKKCDRHIYKKRKPLHEFIDQLKQNSFLTEQIIDESFSYKFVDAKAMFNHYFIQLAFLSSWKELIQTERRAEVFALIEAQIDEKVKQQGFFELSVPFVVIDCVRM